VTDRLIEIYRLVLDEHSGVVKNDH
jgi:hypothetical protein